MTPRQVALGADIFTGLVAVSVAAALGNLVWHGLMPPREPRAIVTHGRAPAATEVDIAPIVALAPFGSAAPAGDGGAGQAIVLRGIMLANPATLSTALIADSAGHVLAYRIGQSLPNGATLTAIARDQVLLQGGSGPIRLGFTRSIASGSDDTIVLGTEPADALAAAARAGQVADQTIVLGDDTASPAASSVPAAASGVAAIRALIPPAVAGIKARPPGQAPPQQTSPQPMPQQQGQQ